MSVDAKTRCLCIVRPNLSKLGWNIWFNCVVQCFPFVFPLLSCFVAKKVSDAENPEFRLLPSFLFGQSMGGAVALKVHLKQPDAWNGAVLAAPMCKVP